MTIIIFPRHFPAMATARHFPTDIHTPQITPKIRKAICQTAARVTSSGAPPPPPSRPPAAAAAAASAAQEIRAADAAEAAGVDGAGGGRAPGDRNRKARAGGRAFRPGPGPDLGIRPQRTRADGPRGRPSPPCAHARRSCLSPRLAADAGGGRGSKIRARLLSGRADIHACARPQARRSQRRFQVHWLGFARICAPSVPHVHQRSAGQSTPRLQRQRCARSDKNLRLRQVLHL